MVLDALDKQVSNDFFEGIMSVLNLVLFPKNLTKSPDVSFKTDSLFS